ncbi:MAG: efflux RND transporter periplasmic adaptor subunit [Gammaproteobacteria bacterium]
MRKWLSGVVVVIALLVLAVLFWPSEPLNAALATVGRGLVEQVVSNTRAGTITACRRSKLSMPMGGRVERLNVDAGDHVVAGQILLEIWNNDREALLAQAQAGRTAADALQRQSCLTADQSARDAERVASLAKQQLVSADAVDQATTRQRAAAAACEATTAQAGTARAAVRVQEALLEETRLRAPFAGVVAAINGEIGEYVTPSPPGVPTPPAVDLIDDSCLYVTAPIDEVDAAQVRTELPARITMDAFRGRHFDGTVQRIAPFVLDREKQARTVDVEVRFNEAPGDILLLAGYSADVDIVLKRHENVLRIPAEALLDGVAVLVRDPQGGTLSRREVSVGVSNWTWIEIRSGLEAGEQVVTSLDRPGVVAGAKVEPDAAATAKATETAVP